MSLELGDDVFILQQPPPSLSTSSLSSSSSSSSTSSSSSSSSSSSQAFSEAIPSAQQEASEVTFPLALGALLLSFLDSDTLNRAIAVIECLKEAVSPAQYELAELAFALPITGSPPLNTEESNVWLQEQLALYIPPLLGTNKSVRIIKINFNDTLLKKEIIEQMILYFPHLEYFEMNGRLYYPLELSEVFLKRITGIHNGFLTYANDESAWEELIKAIEKAPKKQKIWLFHQMRLRATDLYIRIAKNKPTLQKIKWPLIWGYLFRNVLSSAGGNVLDPTDLKKVWQHYEARVQLAALWELMYRGDKRYMGALPTTVDLLFKVLNDEEKAQDPWQYKQVCMRLGRILCLEGNNVPEEKLPHIKKVECLLLGLAQANEAQWGAINIPLRAAFQLATMRYTNLISEDILPLQEAAEHLRRELTHNSGADNPEGNHVLCEQAYAQWRQIEQMQQEHKEEMRLQKLTSSSFSSLS